MLHVPVCVCLLQVTPVYVQNQWPNIDWYKYLCLWERLPDDMKHVSDTLGVSESFLAQAVQGRLPDKTESQCDILRLHRRFFTALALHDLVHEVPITRVAKRYGATKGLLQTLQSAAGTFAGMVTVFCKRLGWSNLELLLSQFQSRLTFGVERELCDLVMISLLNGFRARVLYNAGYHTLSSLATANPMAIETCLRNAVPFKSYKLSAEHCREVGSACNNTWCAKLRKGMTEQEAALLIVNEAKHYVSKHLNVPLSAWDSGPPNKVCINPQQIHKSINNSSKTKVSDRIADQNERKRTRNDQTSEEGQKIPSLSPFAIPCQKKKLNPISLDSKPLNRRESQKSEYLPEVASPPVNDISQLAQKMIEGAIPHPPVSDCKPNKDYPLDLSPITAHVCTRTNEQADATAFGNASTSLIGNLSFSTTECEGDGSPVRLPLSISDSLMCIPDSFSFQTLAMIDAACDPEANAEVTCNRSGTSEKPPLAAVVNGENASLGEIRQSICLITPPVNTRRSETPFNSTSMHPCGLKELSSLSSSQLSHNGLTLISVTSNQTLFDTFVSECMEQTTVAFSVACTSVDQSKCIGSVVLTSKYSTGIQIATHLNEQVVGIAFCWGGMDVYYVSLCQNAVENSENTCLNQSSEFIPLDNRIAAIRRMFGRNMWRKVIAYDMKKHAKWLALACGVMPAPSTSLDPVVASWMLDPDAQEKTIHRMVLQYLPGEPLLSECEDYAEIPLSSVATNVGDPEMQASAECVLAFLLNSKLEMLLRAEQLYDSYVKLEMPSLLVLAKVELNGIGFSPTECTKQRDILQCRLTELELQAYDIAGHTFSLTSPEDVSSVLFHELKLPSSSDAASKQRNFRARASRKASKKVIQHLSTVKDVLEKIRPLHPMPGLVLEWRRISATLTKMVYPLLKSSVPHPYLQKSFRIYPSIQVHTATGRVSISDPSLQMVPKEFDIGNETNFSLKANPLMSHSQYLDKEAHVSQSRDDNAATTVTKPSSVCMRDVFQSFPGAIFLAADYSQLELRILAHMSGDEKLGQFLNSDGDVFRMIAGEWLEVPPAGVSDEQRQEAKQICYGMIYGIGPKALSDQLGITEREAAHFMETFRSKYPTMRRFIAQVIQECRDKGNVTTLLGRKRFLPGIHSANVHARNQAERQAVNTTIQGSAADLVKTAMVNIDKVIHRLCQSSVMCVMPSSSSSESRRPAAYLTLQLHDELLFEVLETDLDEVASIVRHEMENALELSVKFPVKLKSGHSWGRLKPLSI